MFGYWEKGIKRRSSHKDSYPNCYDISSAGHVPEGSTYEKLAIWELKEELGIIIEEHELCQIGETYSHSQYVFYEKDFHNIEVSRIYVLWYDGKFAIQEELSCVRWIELDECKKKWRKIHFWIV